MDLEKEFEKLHERLGKLEALISKKEAKVISMPIPDSLVTTKEAMSVLGIKTVATFRNYCKNQGIDAVVNGKPKRYSLNQILKRA